MSRFLIDFASLAVGYYSTLVKSISAANFLAPLFNQTLAITDVSFVKLLAVRKP